MSETGVRGRMDHWAEYCHGDGWDDYGNRCVRYADSQRPCDACCEQNGIHNSGGFVETDSPITKNGKEHITTDNEVTLFAYVEGKEKPIEIKGVREESITFELDKDNVRILTFEFGDAGMRIGYVPGLTYFVTE